MVNKDKRIEKQAYYTIPVEGSLGLLALGAVGLKAWREVRRKAKADSENQENPESNG